MVKIRFTEQEEEGWVPWQDVDAGDMTSLVDEPLKDHDLHPPQTIRIEINVNNEDADVLARTIFQLVEEICEYFKHDQNAYCSIFDTLELGPKRKPLGIALYGRRAIARYHRAF